MAPQDFNYTIQISSPGLSLGLGLFSTASQAQAQFKPSTGLGLAGLKWAGLGWALGPAQHITSNPSAFSLIYFL